MWQWNNDDPFGNNAPNENPSNLGAFTCNLRLPGQYFDKETNIHYNYFRDYDPAIGRYVQSDPIGLEGGSNTYAYALLNPLSFIDKWGLLTSITVWQPVRWTSASAGHVSTNINGTTVLFCWQWHDYHVHSKVSGGATVPAGGKYDPRAHAAAGG